MSAMVVLNSEGEVADLITWLDDHPDPDDFEWPFGEVKYGKPIRERAQKWLKLITDEHGPDRFPIYAPVPTELIPAIEAVIDDWAEVLGANNDTSYSHIVHSAEDTQ